MSTVIDLDRRPPPLSSASVDEFIAASGARLSDRIIVAGAAHLEFLIALTRRGFQSVTCQSPSHAPHIPNSKAEAILAPAVVDEASLLDIVDRLGSELRPGGALVIEASRPINSRTDSRLVRALLRHGLGELVPVAGGNAGSLWCTHKRDAALVRAA